MADNITGITTVFAVGRLHAEGIAPEYIPALLDSDRNPA